MLLQSANHFYIHENKSKYLFPLHPLITAFYLAYEGKSPEMLQKIKDTYSAQESDIYYRQYLFIKEHFINNSKTYKPCYGHINDTMVENSFNSVRHIVFEVTDKCNLQCVYCAYGDCYTGYDKRNHKNLDFDRAKILLDYFIPIWKKQIEGGVQVPVTISFYGGEPLLNFKFITQIVSYCESLGFKKAFFTYSMTTNGLLIKKYQNYLVEKKFRLMVSLDGDKENHSFRIKKSRENSFDEIMANLKSLKKSNPDYFDQNISFISVMHKKNSMPESITFIKNEFDKLPTITPLSTDDVIPDKKEYFEEFINRDSSNDITDELLKEFTDAELGKYDVYSFMRKNARHYFNHYHDIYEMAKNTIITPTGTCIPFTRKVYLSTNGKILPCERVHIQHTLGKVSKTKGVMLDFDAIAKYFNKSVNTFTEHCKNCYNRPTCEICVFKYSGEPCEKFVDNIEFLKIIYGNLALIETYPHTYQYIKQIVID